MIHLEIIAATNYHILTSNFLKDLDCIWIFMDAYFPEFDTIWR